jgi:hypothetical protein
MSPFQSQVIDATLARANREREIARTGEMADITRAGAFGNERRGVFEAERQAAFELGQNEMIANLMSARLQPSASANYGAAWGAVKALRVRPLEDSSSTWRDLERSGPTGWRLTGSDAGLSQATAERATKCGFWLAAGRA